MDDRRFVRVQVVKPAQDLHAPLLQHLKLDALHTRNVLLERAGCDDLGGEANLFFVVGGPGVVEVDHVVMFEQLEDVGLFADPLLLVGRHAAQIDCVPSHFFARIGVVGEPNIFVRAAT